MKNSSVIAIPSSSSFVVPTLVYALVLVVAITFFEVNNAFGEAENFNDVIYTQQEVEKPCKSPCPPNAELCIAMCV